jgi:hypothetical protein
MIDIYKFLIKIFIGLPIFGICGILKLILCFLLSDWSYSFNTDLDILEYLFDKRYRKKVNSNYESE